MILYFSTLLIALILSWVNLSSADCIKETGLQERDVPKNFEALPNATETYKCFVKCLMEEAGILQNGEFRLDKAAEEWKQDSVYKTNLPKMLEIGNSCKLLKGENDCKQAFNINVCILQKAAEVFPVVKDEFNLE
ncbi:general odorant-binding protein 56h-like [Musca domestica]|uniref:General odorant-binding protein 56h-like n=1 Tax=Musca domestica TaxID=7370 RepID=A0A1I8M2Z6_MUSDO|nr:general odorant-binding protein 56h-like [Musca domestica]